MHILSVVLALILLGNLAVLDYFQFLEKKETKVSEVRSNDPNEIADLKAEIEELKAKNTPVVTATEAACPSSCVSLIDKNLGKKTVTTKSVTTSKGEYVIPLGEGEVTQIGSWVDLKTTEATINTANFGTIKEAYFEALMHVPKSEGEVRAKLVDVTTPYSYDGNQLVTTSSTGQFVSSKINLQPGSKTYRVQLMASISRGVLDYAQIKIVTN